MNTQRIIGIVLLVVGVIVLTIGMNASHSAADRATNFFTGHFTDSTAWYIVVGAVASLAGLFMTAFGRKVSQ